MKKIFRNNYFEVEFYYKGIVLGIIVDDEYSKYPDVLVLLPFFVLKFKTYNFNRSNEFKKSNEL